MHYLCMDMASVIEAALTNDKDAIEFVDWLEDNFMVRRYEQRFVRIMMMTRNLNEANDKLPKVKVIDIMDIE